MSSLAETMESWIDQHGAVLDGSRVLVAVSGGVDSMVLLSLLQELEEGREWRLVAAHLNHQLRGRSSDADERFVRGCCAKLGVPCAVARRDVKALAKRRKISIEMAAREARHQFLAQTARKRDCPVIALGHHADDQAELVLLRLLRGSGSDGLGGMSECGPSPADSRINLVRPLLGVRRQEIQTFAEQHGIKFREDRSNVSTQHLRNRVRHELLPLLREGYQPAVESVLCRTAAILSAEAECIQNLASEWLANGGRPFEQLPLALRRRLIQMQAVDLGVSLNFDLTEQLVVTAGRKVNVPGGRSLTRNPDGHLVTVKAPALPSSSSALAVSLGASGAVRHTRHMFRWQVVPMKRWKPPSRRPGEERFDADQVGRRIVLRHWRTGDRFQPIGMEASAKLQDQFINLKVDRHERHRRVVAESESGEIFWVEGFRVGDRFQLRAKTRKQLVWRWNCS